MEIEVTILTVGMIQTNCYIVNRKDSSSCLVIDPGAEAGKIAEYIDRKHLKNEAILLTHGHYDHIMGVSELISLVGGEIYACEEERELLADPRLNVSLMAMRHAVSLEADHFLRDGERFTVADIEFEVIYTPGHTHGGCCFYQRDEKLLFSGDTVFMESVGRTDLPTGNSRELLQSLREKILTLPSEVQIYPGHGPDTSVGYEMAYNPYA